ncbi:MAG: integration host factor subunit beta [Acidobacteriota bacterium]|jgi:DNA-binding protein HU-beta
MIKADIVSAVASVSGLSHLKAQESVDEMFHCIREALVGGEKVEFRGFGVFRVKDRKRGMGRNLKTGEAVPIAPGKTVKFKPSSRFSPK